MSDQPPSDQPPSDPPGWGAPPPSPPPGYGTPPPGYPPQAGYGTPAYGYGATMGPKPDNYLVPAILTTLFCCLPMGIAAIVFAAQVDGKYNSGDYAGAVNSAQKAKQWTWLSFGLGLAVIAIYLFAVFVLAASRETTY